MSLISSGSSVRDSAYQGHRESLIRSVSLSPTTSNPSSTTTSRNGLPSTYPPVSIRKPTVAAAPMNFIERENPAYGANGVDLIIQTRVARLRDIVAGERGSSFGNSRGTTIIQPTSLHLPARMTRACPFSSSQSTTLMEPWPCPMDWSPGVLEFSLSL